MPRERRGFARLYVGVEGNYSRKDREIKEKKVLVQDISASGIRFITAEKLDKGVILDFDLNVPGLPVTISTKGRVVWQKNFSESFFDTGIEFIDIAEDKRQMIAEFIQKSLGRVHESRIFVRSNLSVMVKFTRIEDPGSEYRAISEDVSPSGIKILVKSELETGTLVDLQFTLPDDEKNVSAQARVVWSRKREEQFYEVGLEFVKIDDIYVGRIAAYIKKTLGIKW